MLSAQARTEQKLFDFVLWFKMVALFLCADWIEMRWCESTGEQNSDETEEKPLQNAFNVVDVQKNKEEEERNKSEKCFPTSLNRNQC